MSLVQLLEGTLAALVAGTLIGQILRYAAHSEAGRATVANINARIIAWWVLCGVTALALLLGAAATCALFASFSVLALREFLDGAGANGVRKNGGLLYTIALVQYGLVWSGSSGLLIWIPIGAFLAIPVANLMSGTSDCFWQRTVEQFWGLTLTVYCPGFAPALLTLPIPGYEGRNATLLFYLLLITQSSDIFQYVWGKLIGRRPVAPRISPNKTWEGLIGGILSATALGTVLYRATPFQPWQAAVISAAVTSIGFFGGLTMSAIKRERGIKDYGTLVKGHGGMLDRIDSLCFAAPVFYFVLHSLFTK